MKLIAHRGGNIGKENTVEAMITAARMGADYVECDIRKTKDGELVIFHDPSLSRLAGRNLNVTDVMAGEMAALLEANGRTLLTFDRLCKEYRENTPILLHIKLTDPDEEFVARIAESGLPITAGVMSLPMLSLFAAKLPKERILAFMPKPEMAADFYAGGAGILRLWEDWLTRISPADLHASCPGAQVFIMAYDPSRDPEHKYYLPSMDGSIDTLNKCVSLGADGILLNDLAMALEWRRTAAQ